MPINFVDFRTANNEIRCCQPVACATTKVTRATTTGCRGRNFTIIEVGLVWARAMVRAPRSRAAPGARTRWEAPALPPPCSSGCSAPMRRASCSGPTRSSCMYQHFFMTGGGAAEFDFGSWCWSFNSSSQLL